MSEARDLLATFQAINWRRLDSADKERMVNRAVGRHDWDDPLSAEDLSCFILNLRAEVEDAEEARRWIPVSERLPPNGEVDVLGWDGERIKVVRWQAGHWRSELDEEIAAETYVTHWMPLPEPPEP